MYFNIYSRSTTQELRDQLGGWAYGNPIDAFPAEKQRCSNPVKWIDLFGAALPRGELMKRYVVSVAFLLVAADVIAAPMSFSRPSMISRPMAISRSVAPPPRVTATPKIKPSTSRPMAKPATLNGGAHIASSPTPTVPWWLFMMPSIMRHDGVDGYKDKKDDKCKK